MNNLSDEDLVKIKEDLSSDKTTTIPYQNKTDDQLREYFKQ